MTLKHYYLLLYKRSVVLRRRIRTPKGVFYEDKVIWLDNKPYALILQENFEN